METKVLTQEEINSLKEIQNKRIQLTEKFGLLEMQYETQKQLLINELSNLLKQEEQIGTQLQQKYGDGSIDLEKGEFTSN
jgi:hypothetical protein